MVDPGYEEPDGASISDPDGTGPAIGFLRVHEAKTTKNRMHIDIRVAGQPWDMPARENLVRAKVEKLTATGATAVREEFCGEHLGHLVMLDRSITSSASRKKRGSPRLQAPSAGVLHD